MIRRLPEPLATFAQIRLAYEHLLIPSVVAAPAAIARKLGPGYSLASNTVDLNNLQRRTALKGATAEGLTGGIQPQ